MAELAVGRPCETCGTLTTYSGAVADPQLSGTCPYCNAPKSIVNPNAPDPALTQTAEAPAVEDGGFIPPYMEPEAQIDVAPEVPFAEPAPAEGEPSDGAPV